MRKSHIVTELLVVAIICYGAFLFLVFTLVLISRSGATLTGLRQIIAFGPWHIVKPILSGSGWALPPIVLWVGPLAVFAGKGATLSRWQHVLLVLTGAPISLLVVAVLVAIPGFVSSDPKTQTLIFLVYVPTIIMSAICLILIPIFHRLRRQLSIENLFQ